jgi:hypothetical protein
MKNGLVWWRKLLFGFIATAEAIWIYSWLTEEAQADNFRYMLAFIASAFTIYGITNLVSKWIHKNGNTK